MQRLHVDGRLHRSVAATGTENIGSPALKLRFPRCDLIGVDVELLRKLSQRSIALDGGKRHLRLEGRCVVPARSSAHGLSWFAGHSVPAIRQKLHLSPCADFRDRLYPSDADDRIELPLTDRS